jgi:hypothetical protein
MQEEHVKVVLLSQCDDNLLVPAAALQCKTTKPPVAMSLHPAGFWTRTSELCWSDADTQACPSSCLPGWSPAGILLAPSVSFSPLLQNLSWRL